MLRPFGYFDVIGTRYHDEDYYGEVIEKNVGDVHKTTGPCWEASVNHTTGLKILIGRAWELKKEIKEQLDSGVLKTEDLAEQHYHVLYPEILSYKFLRQEQQRDDAAFEGQYNQNPRPDASTPFTRPMLLKATVAFNQMPFRGPVSQTWDFAFSPKKGRDYSTASCAVWDEKGGCYIQDMIRGRFHHLELARAVVDFAKKWHPFVIGIEDTAGSRFLEPTIIAEAQKTGNPFVMAVCSKIDWIKATNERDSKRTRMAAMQPWILGGRLKFAAHLPQLEVLYSEFERCLTSHHHDDIPDVISRQVKYAPAMQMVIEKQGFNAFTRTDMAWHMLYEEGYFGPNYGWLLSHNPESGELEWNAPVIQSPMIEPVVDVSARPDTPDPSYDPVLGAGLCG
jgi:predicted phage terminase large subunit-like protein